MPEKNGAMHETFAALRPLRVGLLFALLASIYGFGLGAAFGAAEDDLKGHLKEEAQAVLETKYDGDPAKAKKVYDKAWVYMKRAHLHANGLGASSLALILLLAVLRGGKRLRSALALFLGVGALGYGMYWMFAALAAPGMGSTGAAKESLEWLAIPTSGMLIIGLVLTTFLLVRTAFGKAG